MKKNSAALKVFTKSADGNNVYECGDRFVIGKSGSADLAFDMDFVSRRHLYVCKENNAIQLVDLNSANGTYINNKKIDPNVPYAYKKGDIVYLGNKKLALKIEDLESRSDLKMVKDKSITQNSLAGSIPKNLSHPHDDPDLAFLNDDNPEVLHFEDNTVTQLQQIQEQRMKLMQAETERKVHAEYQQKMLEANEKSLLFINQAKQNAQRIVMEAKNHAQIIIGNANNKSKNIFKEANQKIAQMNMEIQSFEKETKLKAEQKAEEIILKAEEKATNLTNNATASLEKLQHAKNIEIQKSEDRINEYKRAISHLENQKREKDDLFRKITSDINVVKDQLGHTDLVLEKYKIQMKDLETELKKLENDKEMLIRDQEKRKYDFDHYIHFEETKLKEEGDKIRFEVEKLFNEKQTLQETVDSLGSKKTTLDKEVNLLLELKSKEDLHRNEKKSELDKLQNSIEELTQKKFELIKETDKSLAGVREDAIKNRNEALRLLENAKIKDEEINKKVNDQENRLKILITETKNREEKAHAELHNLQAQIEKARSAASSISADILNNAKNESRKINEKLLDEIQKKQKEAESYYNKKIADADNILNNARLEQQKIEEHIKQKKQDAKNAGDSYLNNVKFQVDLQKNKLLEEATRTAKEMVENAKTKSNKLMEEVNNSYQERMKKIEMDTAAKMAFEEEESQKRIEQFRKQEEALKAQRVKEVYRNIKDVIIGRLNSNVGKPLSSGITNLIQEDLQNIIKLAFGYQMNERESIRGILFSGNLSKKVKMYWLKVGLSIFIPIFLLSIHLMAPNFFPAIGKHVVSFLTTEESASDIFIKQMLEARKNKPKYLPPLSAHYKPTYTDNILFTEAFIDTVTSPVFQKEWVIELNKFIVNDLGLSENAIVSFIAKETRLIYELFEIRTKIKPENAQREIDKMKKLELQYEAELISILGNKKDNYRKFAHFRQQFYTKFKNTK
ncbi:MAG: hypothetical protein A2577_13340 [Bdellovibrionales bacterium RIFOXYD1_FULL_36_51]|nr:MAG: hypothetical protein A2417_02450 [Bdellovibrionales bacterium RIFOXYC1_FULL_37_79]OFZ64645.1 MAG: hypothetical protein A2577_13340 [Bdellovibrionales bacterium RIFOXYD1_FULL_36_51]